MLLRRVDTHLVARFYYTPLLILLQWWIRIALPSLIDGSVNFFRTLHPALSAYHIRRIDGHSLAFAQRFVQAMHN